MVSRPGDDARLLTEKELGSSPRPSAFTGRGVVWFASLVWSQVVVGSNPTALTLRGVRLVGLRHLVLSQEIMGSNPIRPTLRHRRNNRLVRLPFKQDGAGSNPVDASLLDVAQHGQSTPSGGSGHRFESCRPGFRSRGGIGIHAGFRDQCLRD